MLAKILLLAGLVVLVLYIYLPCRRAARGQAGRGFLFCCAASGVLLASAILACLLWMSRSSLSGVDGKLDFLLPLGLVQVLLALVCGVLAYRRRPR
ncbi:hypothetical protein [Bordetella holmesii]|uniref:Membrane protein n=2 Tax=Bordetella holmesii TaxID=35814 RepID=A0ABP3BKS3_9BORD|nr:hypothetical protein [Bordetella holmesii]AIT28535.1 putative membrane protein [Bordetella holmesii 44057]EWM41321.1 putative membrane protein [Bordetella holmesii 35009]EWM42795.1 putative membrane protein [Bordetella holmesii 41130]EWM45217.1 putative membrane protein [Bordetella holmesii 70147]AMD47174.1 hypothetical protein H558_17730 [Bordetella holmesii H558]